MLDYIEWVKEYVKELDSLLATGVITLRQYWAECKVLCDQLEEKIKEEQEKQNKNVFDKMLGDPIKIIERWFGE